MNDLEQKILRNPPIENFLEEKFRSFGFEQLTNIQKKAIPVIYQKKNSLIIAPTGSGKTECSVIPIFSHVKKTKEQGKIKVLYITPLRALNRDVFRRIIKYAEQDCLTIQIRHGDTSQTMRKKISDSPPDILITTPETLVILLTQKKMLTALSELEWVVIDEVHELLASERGSQLSLSLERLQLNSNQQIIRNGLSATIGNTDEAAKFLVGTHRSCEIVQDQTIRNYQVEVKFVGGSISEVADSIIQYVEKSNLDSPILLFTNTRGESEFLASILKEKTTINVELHHGSLSKQVREETESVLRSGANGIVVCTSSLELGLDIGSVELVIHYGSPRQVSKLVQRIGRSRHSKNSSARGLVISNSGDEKLLQINVEPVTGGGKKVPYWEGENIPVDFDTAQKVGLLRTKVKQGSLSMSNKIISELDYNIIPDEKTIVVESLRTEGTLVIHACFGSRINSTLATILSSFLSSTLGYVVESRSDAYRIVLTSNARIRKKIFVETLIEKFNLYDIISVSLTGTHNVNWRTWCVAKKFGIVSRGSIYDRKSGHFLYERYQNTPVVKESLRELFHDKFDLTGTEDIITRIRNNEIQIEWIDVNKFSKLAEPLLDHTTKYYSSPASVDKAVLDLVKKRLFKTKHRLVCARCGKWQLAIITEATFQALLNL